MTPVSALDKENGGERESHAPSEEVITQRDVT